MWNLKTKWTDITKQNRVVGMGKKTGGCCGGRQGVRRSKGGRLKGANF